MVCRDCGEHLPYDWDLMRVVKDGAKYVSISVEELP